MSIEQASAQDDGVPEEELTCLDTVGLLFICMTTGVTDSDNLLQDTTLFMVVVLHCTGPY